MNKDERIKKIKNENNIWIIYLIIIGLSYLANYYEEIYFKTNNEKSKERYRKINALVFSILLIIYTYYENDAINSYKNNNPKTKIYDLLILIATTLVLISGIIFLYIIIVDNNIDEEVAFN